MALIDQAIGTFVILYLDNQSSQRDFRNNTFCAGNYCNDQNKRLPRFLSRPKNKFRPNNTRLYGTASFFRTLSIDRSHIAASATPVLFSSVFHFGSHNAVLDFEGSSSKT